MVRADNWRSEKQWFKNGDHPEDRSVILIDSNDKEFLSEGKIVRRFRNPDVPGDHVCSRCRNTMHEHGWIDTGPHGRTVCPGDWIIKIVDEFYPCKPELFEALKSLILCFSFHDIL